MSKPDLSTYGGRLRDLGYAGQIVDTNPVEIDTKINDQATAIDFGVAVARSAADDTCKAPTLVTHKVLGISVRHAIRPADASNNVNYAQKDAVPVCRKGPVYAMAAENVSRGDTAVALTASNGALGSAANNTAGAAAAPVADAGNTGNGTMTMDATTPVLAGAKNGTYTATCIATTPGAVAANGTSAAVAGNTGNGTITAAPATGAGATQGVYSIVCVEPATDGGIFEVTAPNGKVIGKATVGAEFSTQITFTIADGATDFAAGDAFTVTVGGEQVETFRVEDPDGNVLGDVAVGATFADDIKFVIADGATDFVVGDKFTVAVTTNAGRIQLDGTNGNVKAAWETTTAAGSIGIVRVAG